MNDSAVWWPEESCKYLSHSLLYVAILGPIQDLTDAYIQNRTIENNVTFFIKLILTI